MKISLRSIWEDLRQSYGDLIEPFDSWINANMHRMHWRPEKVRVVLLAESHVFTTLDESLRKVDLPKGVPDGFVKLVYCLGYGESQLLDQPMDDNPGTWQFWKIFYSCLHRIETNEDFAPVLKRQTPFPKRMENKLEILAKLKQQGIWLLDASLAALYPRPDAAGMYEACIEKSWPYVLQLISDASPERIVVIGAGVRDRLGSNLDALGVAWDWVCQPNAHLTAEAHIENFQKLYDLVHGFDSASGARGEALPTPTPSVPCSEPTCYEWTYNEQSGHYSRGGLSLDKSPILLTLYRRESAGSPRTKVIDSVSLDLRALLKDGYIQNDGKSKNVRIRIIHAEDGRFYVQCRNGSPRYLLG